MILGKYSKKRSEKIMENNLNIWEKVISVVVITYNSQSTILETLESIKKQTYGTQLIQLVITDDYSSDNTEMVVNEWLEQKSKEFHSTLFITNTTNQGIPINFNRGYKAAKGEWIKPIAGDDLLSVDCISNFMEYSRLNKSAEIIISKQKSFGSKEHILPDKLEFFELNVEEQYVFAIKSRPFITGPSLFIKQSLISRIGWCEEKYRWIEDLPLYLKVLKAGIKIHLLDKITVYYRVEESVTQSQNKYLHIESHFCREKVFQDLVYPTLKKVNKIIYLKRRYEFFCKLIISFLTNNKKGRLSEYFTRLFFFYAYLARIPKLINRKNK